MKDVTLAPYSADRTGSVDATAAIQQCLNDGFVAYLPNGTYKTSATIDIPAKLGIVGDGSGCTVIMNTSSTAPTVKFTDYGAYPGAWFHLTGVMLNRAVSPLSGAHGLYVSGYTSKAHIYDVASWNSDCGFFLGATDYGTLTNCSAEQNIGDGLKISNAFTNPALTGSIQWNVTVFLSQGNNGNGVTLEAAAGKGQGTCGKFIGLNTYANGGRGFVAIGAGPGDWIPMVRLQGCFLGEDNLGEVYLDTKYGQHQIVGCNIELAGMGGPKGRGGLIPASQSANAVYIAGSQNSCSITDTLITQSASCGIWNQSKDLVVSGCTITDNGVSGNGNSHPATGILSTGGGDNSIIANGNRIGNDLAAPTRFGIYLDSSSHGSVIVGNDLRGYSIAGLGGIAPAAATGNAT